MRLVSSVCLVFLCVNTFFPVCPIIVFYFNITIFYQVNALNAFQNFKLLLSKKPTSKG